MSRELKRRGFRFVGSTICYALMQAVGMVNDHLVACFRHAELATGSLGDRSLAKGSLAKDQRAGRDGGQGRTSRKKRVS